MRNKHKTKGSKVCIDFLPMNNNTQKTKSEKPFDLSTIHLSQNNKITLQKYCNKISNFDVMNKIFYFTFFSGQ